MITKLLLEAGANMEIKDKVCYTIAEKPDL